MLTIHSTLVVLGGSGFIGSHVIREAIATGWHVKALVRSDASDRNVSENGATAFRGDADDPAAWIHEVEGAHAIVNLIQPKLPDRLGRAQLRQISERQQRFTKALVEALRTVAEDRRPILISVSGIDDLSPDTNGLISPDSPLRTNDWGFSPIGVPVRRIVEQSGQRAAHVYLGTVYGPGKAFADTIFPRLATGKWKNFGTDLDRMVLIHVDDAARALVRIAESVALEIAGRSFVFTDTVPIAMSSFFGFAARIMKVPAPGRVPRWLATLVAGRPLVETTTSRLSIRSSPMEPAQPLRYPSYVEGLPPTLTALGYPRTD